MATSNNRAPSEEGEVPDASPARGRGSGDTIPNHGSAGGSGASALSPSAAVGAATPNGTDNSAGGAGGAGGRDVRRYFQQRDGSTGGDLRDPDGGGEQHLELRQPRERGRSRDRDPDFSSHGGGGAHPGFGGGTFGSRFHPRAGSGAYRSGDGAAGGRMVGRR
ncbi:unnamed protein product, partial [Ectocarpus sp. 13 AM-2016]